MRSMLISISPDCQIEQLEPFTRALLSVMLTHSSCAQEWQLKSFHSSGSRDFYLLVSAFGQERNIELTVPVERLSV